MPIFDSSLMIIVAVAFRLLSNVSSIIALVWYAAKASAACEHEGKIKVEGLAFLLEELIKSLTVSWYELPPSCSCIDFVSFAFSEECKHSGSHDCTSVLLKSAFIKSIKFFLMGETYAKARGLKVTLINLAGIRCTVGMYNAYL